MSNNDYPIRRAIAAAVEARRGPYVSGDELVDDCAEIAVTLIQLMRAVKDDRASFLRVMGSTWDMVADDSEPPPAVKGYEA